MSLRIRLFFKQPGKFLLRHVDPHHYRGRELRSECRSQAGEAAARIARRDDVADIIVLLNCAERHRPQNPATGERMEQRDARIKTAVRAGRLQLKEEALDGRWFFAENSLDLGVVDALARNLDEVLAALLA